ncbi:hypothetical protein [Cryobacterium roopkundense]|uniref:Uncharacterized protein YodC (DUF2158 family) n=1 Tax=Cryobacterium roopkundense TaxID=1001240 RepID=A0A7W8ZZT5_9MICO|nr:hypothetical protein [Cryobacterium roopkundense]MBB5643010.1 uncharacterized protein YodC (DUF2158 family) [Cryobacterium roopkundense]
MAGVLDGNSMAGIISEILTLVGLAAGVPLLITGLIVRGVSHRWVKTDGVIAVSKSGTVIRWFDGEGDVHAGHQNTHESQGLVPGDDIPVWFVPRSPDRCRTDDPSHDGRALRLTGLILVGVGVIAAIFGFVLMFI